MDQTSAALDHGMMELWLCQVSIARVKMGAISGVGSVSKTGTFSLLRITGTPLSPHRDLTVTPRLAVLGFQGAGTGRFGVSKTLWTGTIVNQLSLVPGGRAACGASARK